MPFEREGWNGSSSGAAPRNDCAATTGRSLPRSPPPCFGSAKPAPLKRGYAAAYAAPPAKANAAIGAPSSGFALDRGRAVRIRSLRAEETRRALWRKEIEDAWDGDVILAFRPGCRYDR